MESCHSFPACSSGVLAGLFNICDKIRKQQARCETAGWQNLLQTMPIYPPLGYWFEPLILLQTLADTPWRKRLTVIRRMDILSNQSGLFGHEIPAQTFTARFTFGKWRRSPNSTNWIRSSLLYSTLLICSCLPTRSFVWIVEIQWEFSPQ